MEVALDFAIQCSPDHPWVREHPAWFYHRPDGSIKCAENPPFRYDDIYPLNFDTDDREALWNAMRDVLLFWVARGVKAFRIDNPHTKPFDFWEWLITEIHRQHPDVIFSGRGVHAPQDHVRAVESRLHAVVHLFHLAQQRARDWRRTSPSSPRRL